MIRVAAHDAAMAVRPVELLQALEHLLPADLLQLGLDGGAPLDSPREGGFEKADLLQPPPLLRAQLVDSTLLQHVRPPAHQRLVGPPRRHGAVPLSLLEGDESPQEALEAAVSLGEGEADRLEAAASIRAKLPRCVQRSLIGDPLAELAVRREPGHLGMAAAALELLQLVEEAVPSEIVARWHVGRAVS